MRYAFIGLGQLGQRLATNLQGAGLLGNVHDLNQDAAKSLVEAGATWCDSPRSAAAGMDAAITCLPSPAATRDVLLGDVGLFAGLRADGTWIEMSTNRPTDIAELAAAAAGHGIATLEAPVTGGVHRATVGEITVLAGGEESLVERHRPALAAMGNPVIRVGELGQASSMKVITNMLAFLHLLGAGEAMMLAKQAGIDLATAFECIRESSGNSFVHETESQVVLSGSYNIGFTLDLACKDIGLTAELAEHVGVPFTVGGFIAKLFEEAREKYGGDAWSPRVVQLTEDAVGTQLRADGFPEELEPS